MRLVENIATLGTGAKKHQQHALPDPSMTTQGRAAAHEHIIDVGSRTHGQQHGQQLQGASSSAALAKHKASPLTDGRLTAGQTALTDGQTEFVDAETERVMEALESILRGGITIADMRDEDGDGDDDAMDGDEDDVDRAALTRALEDLLGVEEEEDDSDEEKHTDWEEDDNDIENHNNDNHQVHNDEDQDTHQRPHASTNTPHRPTPPHNALTVDVVPTPPGAPRVPHMTMKNLSDLELLSDTHSGHQLTDILRQRKHKALAERKPQEGTLAQEICPPCILLMNKMDLLSRREKLLALRWANEMMKLHNFEDVFYISAERNRFVWLGVCCFVVLCIGGVLGVGCTYVVLYMLLLYVFPSTYTYAHTYIIPHITTPSHPTSPPPPPTIPHTTHPYNTPTPSPYTQWFKRVEGLFTG